MRAWIDEVDRNVTIGVWPSLRGRGNAWGAKRFPRLPRIPVKTPVAHGGARAPRHMGRSSAGILGRAEPRLAQSGVFCARRGLCDTIPACCRAMLEICAAMARRAAFCSGGNPLTRPPCIGSNPPSMRQIATLCCAFITGRIYEGLLRLPLPGRSRPKTEMDQGHCGLLMA